MDVPFVVVISSCSWTLTAVGGWTWGSLIVRAGHDYSRRAVVWGLTACSWNCFSRILVPGKYNLHVCCLYSWLGGATMWPEANDHMCGFWSLLGGACAVQICARFGAKSEVQRGMWLVAICAWLEGIWKKLCWKQGQLPIVPGLYPLSSKPRLDAAYARLGATWWMLQCKQRMVAACVRLGHAKTSCCLFGFVGLCEF